MAQQQQLGQLLLRPSMAQLLLLLRPSCSSANCSRFAGRQC
jgi:hypothetical protein